MATDEERLAKAEKFKADGNQHFKAQQYAKALCLYAEAIDISEGDEEDCLMDWANPNLHVYYTNRAFCHIKMENFGSAIADASKAIELKGDFPKGYYRRGSAYAALGKYKEAVKDFKSLVKVAPQDKDAREKLKGCEKQLQSEKFAKAIASEASKPVSETARPEDMVVDDSYEGPRYQRGLNKAEGEMFCKELLEWQKQQHTLPKKYAYMIVLDMIEVLRTYGPCHEVKIAEDGIITVCGDVHGQYYDLLNIWEINGLPSETNPYLFNGDFVDRGSFSIEVILSLFSWKLLLPDHLHLTRGNHETRNMNKLYGFEGEVVKKYDEQLYQLFCEAFCLLPLCNIIEDQIFVVHGGLFSKDDVTLEDIRKLDRIREPPDEGLMNEMLWSDPHELKGRTPSKRGTGVAFGPDVTDKFLKKNNLKMVIRSHEMKEEGYEVQHGGKLVTIFSAPNYCDQMGNKGAFIRIDKKTLSCKYTSFKHVPHPPVRAMQYANPMFGQMLGLL